MPVMPNLESPLILMKTKLLLPLGILACSLISGLSTAQSQTIMSWNSGNISGDTDVVAPTSGQTLVEAYYLNGNGISWTPNPSNPTPTLNGVTFTLSTRSGTTYTTDNGGITITSQGGGNNWYQAYAMPPYTSFTSLSANYQQILAGGLYANNNPQTGSTPPAAGEFTLNNLVVGHSYTLEVFFNQMSQSGPQDETITALSDGSSWSATLGGLEANSGTTGYLGSWITAEFTEATSTSETFYYSADYDSLLNAVELIDTTAVPEPSTVALFSVAVGLVGWVAVRRRRLAVA
jgi:hypothetical protein